MNTSVLTFRLPDPGEGLTEAEIIRWLVAPGDQVAVNQPVVEIETAKSVVELPSPFEGTVESITAAEGALVPVGDPILVIKPAGAPSSAAAGPGPKAAVPPSAATESVLAAADPNPADPASAGAGPGHGDARPATARAGFGQGPADPLDRPLVGYGPAGPPRRVKAKPPVRALARQLGIGLEAVAPTGPGQTVTREDVRRAAGRGSGDEAGRGPGGTAAREGVQPVRGRADQVGRVAAETATREGVRPGPGTAASSGAAPQPGPRQTRQPIRSVRRATAAAMVESAFSAPHASLFIETDATRALRFARRTGLSLLALTAFALVRSAARHPVINASWDQAAGEIVYHHYVNLGVAVDSPRGLLVPTVADAERLRLPDLADAIGQLTTTARAGTTTPEAMRGGTITLTNVGALGVDGGSPILVPGQVAILALGAVRPRPWVHKGKIKQRAVGRLTLTFDHRLIDGADAAAAVKDIAAVLERPDSALT
ncbi:MAG: 2-oxo acid dehydrogenase subunit E2 [Bifidobacteriaceae bacterium]|jgi:pyruvate dehydrogenase E2 component (dihydrolipoamide acetyltransferase)|nr:2-oxo acid dehydrogenase subunit E2 [Bifidobacteriaceae bacterium]